MAIKTTIKPKFLSHADVMHKRLRPKINQFLYRVFYICFDVAKVEELKSKFFSLDKFNLFSFCQKDYGNKDGSSLELWIRKILAEENLNQKVKRIFLFTHPRILGYAFNPVSFWFCLNEEEKIIAVLSEVNNTFGETHSYLIRNEDHSPIHENQWLESEKDFHVSPFFPVKGHYKFRFIFNEKKVAVWIDYFEDEKSLLTSVVASNDELSDKNLIKTFFQIPFMILKVIFLIHYQALKLVVKRNKYFSKPKQLARRLTKSK